MPQDDPESRHSPLDTGSTEERQFHVAEMMVGTAMMFVGFLNVLLSISGGFEFAGDDAHAVVLRRHGDLGARRDQEPVGPLRRHHRFIAAALAFFHYGEVLFWHKQVVFWGTVALVAFFMFKTRSLSRSRQMIITPARAKTRPFPCASA